MGGVVDGALGGLADGALLGLLGRAVRRVGDAVEQPRVDVEAHVHHVDTGIAGVRQRLERGLEEEVPGVLAGPDVDQVHLRCDPGDTEPVDRRADGAGHVRAVPVVVLVDRVHAARVLAGAVDVGHVGDEVAAQRLVEVRRDVRVGAVDAGVDDADASTFLDPWSLAYEPVAVAPIWRMSHCRSASGSGVTRPWWCRPGFASVRPRPGAFARSCGSRSTTPDLARRESPGADRPLGGDPDHRAGAGHRGGEVGPGGADVGVPDLGVHLTDGAAGTGDRGAGRRVWAGPLEQHQVVRSRTGLGRGERGHQPRGRGKRGGDAGSEHDLEAHADSLAGNAPKPST